MLAADRERQHQMKLRQSSIVQRNQSRWRVPLLVFIGLLVWVQNAAAQSTADEKTFPLAHALLAIQGGDVRNAHRILGRMAREGAATSLAEMQPEGGHGRMLRALFDAFGNYHFCLF